MKATQKLNSANKAIYNKISGLEAALLECNRLGLEISRVEFALNSYPCLIAKANRSTDRLLEQKRGVQYGRCYKNGNIIYLSQANVRGVKVKWEDSVKH